MTVPLQQIIRQTLQTIESDAEWLLTGPVIRSRECDIYRATSSTSGLTLAVKHFTATGNPKAALQQYNALQNYQKTMAETETSCRVPTIFGYDTEHRFLVMEWVAGRSLHRLLWTPLLRNEQVETALHRTGHWLRCFHKASNISSSPVVFAHYQEIVEQRVVRSLGGAQPVGSAFQGFGEAYNVLRDLLSCLPPTDAPHAVLHGDFTPFNLLLGNDQTTGFDIWAQVRKPVQVDLARMVTYLTIAYPLLTQQPVYDDPNRFAKRLLPLLEGYGQDLVQPASLHFRLCLLTEYLRRWLVIGSRPRSLKGIVTNTYLIAQVKKQVQTLISTF
ncbi:MAG: phosphotransferase [Deltaproteobacteria bacterium]|nr:phosphotransferase [Deltaproteobacteria bacterium]